MAVLPIRLFPDPVLRKRAKTVVLKELNLQWVKNLTETLYAQPSGIGIAAPQVGVDRRLVVVDVSPRDSTKRHEILINPTIHRREGEVLSREGCMSLPDYTASIKRASRILISWTDERGKIQKRWVEGIEAICLQHEVDHLNGILFIDRVTSLKTDVFPRKRRV